MDLDAAPEFSVVIPTKGDRPGLLRRAIESAAAGLADGSYEILVVSNGDVEVDTGGFPDQLGLRLLHVPEAQANVARNAGLNAARGEYVRFLDDDDYLDPAGTTVQYRAIRESHPDICSGGVRFEDANGHQFDGCVPSDTDLVTHVLRQRGSTLPVAHVFRRAFLGSIRWDPALPYLQDVAWMHSLVLRGEASWLPIKALVGAWCHHDGPRTSVDQARNSRHASLKAAAAIIGSSVDALDAAARLDSNRRAAAAKALWDYAHQGFRHSPRYWSPMARRALVLDPRSRPNPPYFRRPPISWLDPLVAEWALFPVRALAMRFMA